MSSDALLTVGLLIATALLIAGNALFVFHEFAFVMLKQPAVKRLAEGQTRVGRTIVKAARQLDHYIAVDQLGITITSIAVGWIGQPVVARLFEGSFSAIGIPSGAAAVVAFTVAFLSLTAIQMIAGELMPKTIALRHPERVAHSVALPVEIVARVFHPLVTVLNGMGTLTVRAFGVTPQAESHAPSLPPEELNALIQASARAGNLQADPILLRRMLHFSDIEARDLIVPRQDVVAFAVGQTIEEVLEIVRLHSHTRFPVYEESIDNIVGVLNVKDLVQIGPDGKARYATSWRRLVRPIPVLSERASIEQVLHRLSQDKQPLALLIDEFGGTAGILTISDIADELIGGVEDIRQASDHSYIVKGETSVSTLESILDIDLAPEERTYESVGGLVMAELDRMPSVGDTVTTKDGDLRVTAMRGRRVTEVRLTLAGNQQSPEESADG